MRMVMVTRHLPNGETEAEPMTLEVNGPELTLVLDDGERLVLPAHEFAAELDFEMAAEAIAEIGRQAA